MTGRPQRPRVTPDQLRRDIDSGRTGDKVAFPDPAAAPLGTDEEAAGTPIPAHAAAAARRIETARPHHPRRSLPPMRVGRAWMVMTFALLAVALAVVGFVMH
jgi:hypothetical protein